MQIDRLSTALGARITGIDLARDLNDSRAGEIRAALNEYGVLQIPDQQIDDDQHKAIARYFGDIFIHPNFNTGDHDPELVWVVRNPGDTRIVGEEWHADTTMMSSPPMGALLYGQEVPPAGGDTLFAAQWLAYDALSDGMKRTLDSLACVHSDRKVAGPAAALNGKRATVVREDADWQPTSNIHPVVHTHPESGRRCLFVNHSYSVRFDGWSESESRPLLEWLMDWGHRPEFTCRLSWAPGTMVFWDNRSTKHFAVNDVREGRRVMRRVQISGEPIR